MAKPSFEEQIGALDALRGKPLDATTEETLRSALRHRNNYVVAKAADVARQLQLADLTPEMQLAFERFFREPGKTDPQCWAKNALSRAMAAFELQDSSTFLKGMRHIQMEPVWGGRSDTAGPLRGICALALVQCHDLGDVELLAHLIDLLEDPDKNVRLDVVRAVASVGSRAAGLLLRQRVRLGGEEPEILGASLSGILAIEGERALEWVAGFLGAGDDRSGEAALALGESRSLEGFRLLRTRLEGDTEPVFRATMLTAIALNRQPEAVEFLLAQIASDLPDAKGALTALMRVLPSPEVLQRIERAVEGTPSLERMFAKLKAEG
jgi:hypothetical protein